MATAKKKKGPPKRTGAKARGKSARKETKKRAEEDVDRLAKIPGVGRALARQLVRRGIRTRAQMRKIIQELPADTRAELLYRPAKKVPLSRAKTIAKELARRLRFAVPGGKLTVKPVGSIRRKRPEIKDIDLLVLAPDDRIRDDPLASTALAAPGPGDRAAIAESYANGQHRRSLVVRWGKAGKSPKHYRVDLFLSAKSAEPFALFHYTGSKIYNIRTRFHAKRQGWLLNQYGLFIAGTDRRVPGSTKIHTERELAKFLGVTFRPPTDREK